MSRPPPPDHEIGKIYNCGVSRVTQALTFAVALAGSLALSAAGAAPVKDARSTAAGTIAEGRRLAAQGRLAEAAVKLSDGWTASRDPEVLFDLGVCFERLGQSAQALDAFGAYVKLPLALRLRAAEDHVRAIEAKDARDVPAPRRVLVPVAGDDGKCFQTCTGPESCRPRFGDRWGTQCAATQFVCLRACPGAKVESGVCATATVRPGERCRAERGAP